MQLALDGLKAMFLPGKNLSFNRLKRTSYGLIIAGMSYRYMLIALLGLQSSSAGLRVSYEGWSYEFGWLLNAFSDLGHATGVAQQT